MFDDATRTLTTTQSLAVDTQVLSIPMACIVDCHKVPEQVWQQLLDDLGNNDARTCHFSVDDLAVAWYLASQPVDFKPYIASLCLTDIANTLPRNWPPDLVQKGLQGSPVLARVMAQKDSVSQDYHWVESILSPGDNNKTVPSLEAFDKALAVVSSRAFAGKEQQQYATSRGTSNSCLIPLLDLCNHQRGAQQPKKNLRYAWEHSTGNMVVHVARTIAAGDALCITYGAQSNAQLLLNYGFCLENNVEPDGSSNNVYEFVVKSSNNHDGDDSNAKTIILRMGPKSYTYGPLLQVLEALGPAASQEKQEQNDIANQAESQDDMEAFLKECEEGSEDDEEDSDCYMYMGSGMMTFKRDGTGENEVDNIDQQKDFDRLALKNFLCRLDKMLQSYPSAVDDGTNDCGLRYARILVESEKEILIFYRAIVLHLLSKLGDKAPPDTKLPNSQEEQVQTLVDAFFQIRYSLL